MRALVYARLAKAILVGAVLALVVGLAVLLPKCEGPGPHPFNQAAHVTTVRPPSQVVDGLYKSLVVALPGGRVLVCILTRLPLSLPHFTIPPEYSCVRAPR